MKNRDFNPSGRRIFVSFSIFRHTSELIEPFWWSDEQAATPEKRLCLGSDGFEHIFPLSSRRRDSSKSEPYQPPSPAVTLISALTHCKIHHPSLRGHAVRDREFGAWKRHTKNRGFLPEIKELAGEITTAGVAAAVDCVTGASGVAGIHGWRVADIFPGLYD